MRSITPALINLVGPGINFSNPDNVLANVRWDAPLPEGFTPPTQGALDAELARLAAAESASASRIVVERLYFFLGLEAVNLDQVVEDLCNQLAQAGDRKPKIYLRDAKEFESDHELVLQLGQHPSIGLTPEGIRDLFVAMAAAQAARAA